MFWNKKYGISMFFYDISHGIVLLGGSIPFPKKYTVDKKPFHNEIKDEGMIIVGIPINFRVVVKGLVLLVAVLFDVLSKRQKR